jgi:alkylhydroperoxidase/carboxymuconolactone decarboxylase family protein YurZ
MTSDNLHTTESLQSFISTSNVLDADKVLILIGAGSACIQAEGVLASVIRLYVDSRYYLEAMYEGLLQTYLFAGFPCALSALSVFKNEVDRQGLKYTPLVENYDVDLFRLRGEKLCAEIYTTSFSKLRTKLETISPELNEWMIIEGYGKTLSRKGLDIQTRELSIVVVLTMLGWKAQLYSHLRGALNVGANVEQCYSAIRCAEYLNSRYSTMAYEILESLVTQFEK